MNPSKKRKKAGLSPNVTARPKRADSKSQRSQKEPAKDARKSRLRFLTSAVEIKGYPQDPETRLTPEIALVGRSNAGKSSLINGLANSKIAMVSSTPGKTRLLNFFETDRYRFVDMPGYGFAARAGQEQRDWQSMVETYLATRRQLAGLVIVMDIRREWSEDEENLVKWIAPREMPFAIALTKVDKLSRSEALERMRQISRASGCSSLLLTSALKKTGFIELEAFFYEEWIKPFRERRRGKE